MSGKRYTIFTIILFLSLGVKAQKEERSYIRKGNRNFKDSVFVEAEVNYRKALEVTPTSTNAIYNLGNALANQQKFNEALEQYQIGADIEKDKNKLSKIYHNAGVIFQAAREYPKAIEAYKQALRNNPLDDETRYNLALAQKLLDDQQEDQNQDPNQQDQEQQDQQDQNQQDQEQQQDQNQQPQPEQNENEMSKETAEQMLNSVTQDEKDVQEKVKNKQQIMQGQRLEKDW